MSTQDPTSPTTGQEPKRAIEYFGADTPSQLVRVRQLVDLFYDEMHSNPEFARIRALHPADLAHSREKFYEFLAGWLGGPDLYVSKYGHPRLKMRHMPFPINSVDRDQWLSCMLIALRQMGFDERLVEGLMMSFYRTADWMRNKPDTPLTDARGGHSSVAHPPEDSND